MVVGKASGYTVRGDRGRRGLRREDARREARPCGEWGGYTVRRARTGWVVEQWSAVQGSETGGRYLVRYDSPTGRAIEPGEDLADLYSEASGETVGARLYSVAVQLGAASRVLRAPHRVQ